MSKPDNKIIDALQELGLTPLDWVDAAKFSELTGIAERKLPDRKRHWQENVVWTKQNGNIYYSLRGYNQWMTEQADIRYRRASGSDLEASKSISSEKRNIIQSRFRSQSLRKASVQLLKLDAT